jgi:hypothetical protein
VNYIPDAKLAVERAAGCEATHRETSHVVETFNGKVIWAGNVEVFSLSKPPPSIGYGWVAGGDSGGLEYVAVLGTPPIDSPPAAVRAWLTPRKVIHLPRYPDEEVRGNS